MSFRTWRERRLLSQERIAEMSGLSLRTVQRLEAGHRVSYASLRALAVAFSIDVDLLERELYAVNKPTDEFIEIPRWVRLLDDTRWFGGPGLSRKDLHILEALFFGLAVLFFAASFFAEHGVATVFRASAATGLLVAYQLSRFTRLNDKYNLWPGAGSALPQRPRTLRGRLAFYCYSFGAAFLAVATFCWLVF